MVFREKCLSQVYNLCLHNVWSLHPAYVCKVMTFSAHTLSIKLLTPHTHTHTSTTCHYVVISGLSVTGVMIIFMVFFWYLALGGQCRVMRGSPVGRRTVVLNHLKEWNHLKDTFINKLLFFFCCLGGYIFICQRKKLILDDVQWLTSLYISVYTLAAALLRHYYTCPERNCLENVSHSFWHEIWFLQTQPSCFKEPV